MKDGVPIEPGVYYDECGAPFLAWKHWRGEEITDQCRDCYDAERMDEQPEDLE